MRAIGFEVTEKVGKTGLVALYENGDGPTIMVRTDLDALPMEEKTGLPYASRDKTIWQERETFVTHSCGHDIHMASWVGMAKTLVGLKDQWKGTLMFIAQPAEEVTAGARAMLADGLFTRFPKPDAGFALHAGAFPYGSVSYRVGVGSSNADGLYIKFKGRGGHLLDLSVGEVLAGFGTLNDLSASTTVYAAGGYTEAIDDREDGESVGEDAEA